jgi:hypothetical protein
MKKIVKVLSIIILIISILIILAIVVSNLLNIIRIMFFGMTVGTNEYPDSIWWGETFLYGISGVKRFYSVWGEIVLIFEIPICIVCIIYQIVYFKIIRKNYNLEKML